MFWRFGYRPTSNLDQLLQKDNVRLEDVLLDDEIMQELKTQNQKLIEFVSKEENLEKMLQWILFGPKGFNEQNSQNISFISLEILCSEEPLIMEGILEGKKNLLSDAWKILDNEPPLNFTLASNFSKIMASLMAKETEKVFELIKLEKNAVDKLVKHLEVSPIADLLIRLFISDEFHAGRMVSDWLLREDLVKKLIQRIHPSNKDIVQSTASNILIDFISATYQSQSADKSVVNDNIIIKEIKSAEIIKILLANIIEEQGPNKSSTLINGISLINELLRRAKENLDEGANESQSSLNDENPYIPAPSNFFKRDPLDISDMMETILGEIAHFKNFLSEPPTKVEPRSTSIGLQTPVGTERLIILEFFALILQLGSLPNVLKSIRDSGLLVTATEMFFDFPWNNMLHSLYYDMLCSIADSVDNAESKELIVSLFDEAKLANRITEAARLNNAYAASPKGCRLGYMGHITMITEMIIELIQDDRFLPIFDRVSVHLQSEDWHEYITKTHRDYNTANRKTLGGQKPLLQMFGQETENPTASFVDAQTDQLARYIIQQVIAGMPSVYAYQTTQHIPNELETAEKVQDNDFELNSSDVEVSAEEKSEDDEEEDVDEIDSDIGQDATSSAEKLEQQFSRDSSDSDPDSTSDSGESRDEEEEEESSDKVILSADTQKSIASVEATLDAVFGQFSPAILDNSESASNESVETTEESEKSWRTYQSPPEFDAATSGSSEPAKSYEVSSTEQESLPPSVENLQISGADDRNFQNQNYIEQYD